MGRIAIFIDGAYLQYTLKHEFNSPKICFRQLADRMAGDREILPAIDAAKPEGVVIHLFHGERPHTDLVAKCDERTRIDQSFIDSILK